MLTFASIRGGAGFETLRLQLPLAQWIRVARERRRLAGMDERLLRDIGIDEATAAAEASRPFWDLPEQR